MNKKAIMLLLLLRSSNADSFLNSMSIAELMELEDTPELKANTLYKILKTLMEGGLVANGMPDGKAATFYITNAGLTQIGELV